MQAVSVAIAPYQVAQGGRARSRGIAQIGIHIGIARQKVKGVCAVVAVTARGGLAQACRQTVGHFHVVIIARFHVREDIMAVTVRCGRSNGGAILVLESDFHIEKARLSYVLFAVAVCIQPHQVSHVSSAGTRVGHNVGGIVSDMKDNLIAVGIGPVGDGINPASQRVIDGHVKGDSQCLPRGQGIAVILSHKARRVVARSGNGA